MKCLVWLITSMFFTFMVGCAFMIFFVIKFIVRLYIGNDFEIMVIFIKIVFYVVVF